MSTASHRKVLLLGPGNSGKTSMRSIIFANFIALETAHLASTVSIERGQVRFLGNLVLNLWDCPGQKNLINSYFESEKEIMFSNVSVLIFVLDVTSKKVDDDLEDFCKSIDNLAQFSPNSKIFCLCHKMDLVPKESRKKIFTGISTQLKQIAAISNFKLTTFQTSIWEETLYKAWAKIINHLIPNSELISKHLTEFMEITEAEEVVLFEKATFLDISHTTQTRNSAISKDFSRFEKISNIVKLFKLSCMKSGTGLHSIKVHNSHLNAILTEFTNNTYILVVTSDPTVCPAATLLNIQNAKPHFEKLLSL